jgi:signal transduction histidine kinase
MSPGELSPPSDFSSLGNIDVLSALAHDIRTPLTSILFLAEALRNGWSGPLTPLQSYQLGLIYSAAFELSALANDLTDFGHNVDDWFDQEPTSFSVPELLRSVHDIARPLAETRELELRVRTDVSGRRIGQAAALGRVLLNLATNALRCTTRGYVEISAVNANEARVSFAVEDTGEGISAERLAQLFAAPAPRQTHTSVRFGSSGLGLKICQRLVTSMGGTLQAQSTLERGSRFFFDVVLPAGDGDNAL